MNNKNRKYRVLFVDDERRVTSALKAIFRREYDVLVANSGAEALSMLADNAVDVIVSDQRMPGMLGNELLAKVSRKYPNTMRILLTGFMDRAAIVDSINEGEIYRFINKPWRNDEMREVVAEAALASEIPVHEELAKKPSARIASEPAKPANEQALLMIEQKQDVRNQIRRFCSQNQIMIYGTQNIEQAVVAATSRQNIGVAVVELSVDPESALHTINLLKRARPELITIVLTEELDASTAVNLINQGQVFKYLTKPIDVPDFQSVIEKAFVRHDFLKRNKPSQKRYKVEKSSDRISDNLRSLFGRFLGAST
ncbi:MAG: response regulator [Pseudomonadota bacterium]